MIETICENCGNNKSFDDTHRGKKFKCPICQNPVLVMSLGEQLLNIEFGSIDDRPKELTEEEKAIRNEKAKIARQKRQNLQSADEKITMGYVLYGAGTIFMFCSLFLLKYKDIKIVALIIAFIAIGIGYYVQKLGKNVREKYDE